MFCTVVFCLDRLSTCTIYRNHVFESVAVVGTTETLLGLRVLNSGVSFRKIDTSEFACLEQWCFVSQEYQLLYDTEINAFDRCVELLVVQHCVFSTLGRTRTFLVP